MNRFFRSALFPLIVIVLLVYLASQTLIPKSKAPRKVTTADVIARIQGDPGSIQLAQFSPGKRQLQLVLKDGTKQKVYYPSDQSGLYLQTQLIKSHVDFDNAFNSLRRIA